MSSNREMDNIQSTKEKQSELIASAASFSSVNRNEEMKCQFCLQSTGSDGNALLTSDFIVQILNILRIECDPEPNNANIQNWHSCESCKTQFNGLISLFLELQELSKKFLTRKTKIAKRVILGALGKPETEWEAWKTASTTFSAGDDFCFSQVNNDRNQCGAKASNNGQSKDSKLSQV